MDIFLIVLKLYLSITINKITVHYYNTLQLQSTAIRTKNIRNETYMRIFAITLNCI